MEKNANKWWWLYGIICIGVLLPLGIAGLIERTSITFLIETGGLVEQLPAIIYAVSAVLGLVFAWQIRQIKLKFWGWVFYAVMCFFLAGEEAGWGKESVLGWQLQKDSHAGFSDFHNWFAHFLVGLGSSRLQYWVLIVLGIGIAFVTFWIIRNRRRSKESMALLPRLRKHFPPLFLILGCVLILVGSNLDTIQILFGLPYVPGQWPLEESLEVLGSIAILFAVLQTMYCQFQNTGKVKT